MSILRPSCALVALVALAPYASVRAQAVTEIGAGPPADADAVQTVGQMRQAAGINDGVDQPADMQTEDLAPSSTSLLPQAPVAPAAPSATINPGTQGGAGGFASQAPSPVAQQPLTQADPPGRIGRLSVMQGSVSLKPVEQSSWAPAGRNRPLTRGDALYTAKGARAELRIGTLNVRLGEETLLGIRTLDDDTVQLELRSGTLGVHVPKPEREQVVEVLLPSLAAALHASGDYRLEAPSAAPEGHKHPSMVIVRRGSAEVRVGQSVAKLTADAMLRVPPNATAPGKVIAAAEVDSFDGWCAERERILAKAPALKYVAAETAGYEDLDEHGSWTQSAQYGALWQPQAVPVGWAPFSLGHWVWIAPWGWTWVDDMPWGFAPFHYGRWVYYNSAWMWAPGGLGMRPFYLPHLVSFFGGGGFGVSVGFGMGAVGWYPLGWGEPFYPGFGCSYGYLHAINRPYGFVGGFAGAPIPMMNRGAPHSITVISAQTMQHAMPVGPAHHTLPPSALTGAHLGLASPGVHPVAQSLAIAPGPHGQIVAPPAHLMARPMASPSQTMGAHAPIITRVPTNGPSVVQVGRPGYVGHTPTITRVPMPAMPVRPVQPMMPMYRSMPMMHMEPGFGYYGGPGHMHPSVGNAGFGGHFGGESHFGGGGAFYGHPGGGFHGGGGHR